MYTPRVCLQNCERKIKEEKDHEMKEKRKAFEAEHGVVVANPPAQAKRVKKK
jgi:hypothetical protein